MAPPKHESAGRLAHDVAKAPRPILVEGRTCMRLARADRVAVLIDGAAYYRSLLTALQSVRRRITILGWDFDARVRLDPQDPQYPLLITVRAVKAGGAGALQ